MPMNANLYRNTATFIFGFICPKVNQNKFIHISQNNTENKIIYKRAIILRRKFSSN